MTPPNPPLPASAAPERNFPSTQFHRLGRGSRLPFLQAEAPQSGHDLLVLVPAPALLVPIVAEATDGRAFAVDVP